MKKVKLQNGKFTPQELRRLTDIFKDVNPDRKLSIQHINKAFEIADALPLAACRQIVAEKIPVLERFCRIRLIKLTYHREQKRKLKARSKKNKP